MDAEHHPRPRAIWRALGLGAVLALVSGSATAVQATKPQPANASPASSTPAPAPPAPSPPPPAGAPTAAATSAVPGSTRERARRAPLLREGSFISRSLGTLRLDETRNEWRFVPDVRDSSGLERELIALPNETLGEAKRTLDLTPQPLRFEATGEVFIYRGRNYLLLSMMTPLAGTAPTEPVPETPAPTPAASKAPAATSTVDEERIAEELERRLAERIQTVPRAPTPEKRDADTDDNAPATATRDAGATASTLIHSRRGHLMRDGATGGWRFVFEGQPAEVGEPSMPILPCLALERVEAMVRLAEGQAPVLVSGRTTSFEGRTYLLPTSFRLARGGKGINP